MRPLVSQRISANFAQIKNEKVRLLSYGISNDKKQRGMGASRWRELIWRACQLAGAYASLLARPKFLRAVVRSAEPTLNHKPKVSGAPWEFHFRIAKVISGKKPAMSVASMS